MKLSQNIYLNMASYLNGGIYIMRDKIFSIAFCLVLPLEILPNVD